MGSSASSEKKKEPEKKPAAKEPPKPAANESKRGLHASQSDPGPRRDLAVAPGHADGSPSPRKPQPPSSGRPNSGRVAPTAASSSTAGRATTDDPAYGPSVSSVAASPSASPRQGLEPSKSPRKGSGDDWKPDSAESTRSQLREHGGGAGCSACSSDSDGDGSGGSCFAVDTMRRAAARERVAAAAELCPPLRTDQRVERRR
eukprot:CAMPEP_0174865036 /NCGR_PEP_ID=MMETSP1114-20130205/59605_1 /TAXON_ID=312471 /ORGANISM="Neobodo designis, Strain CCAP 1951/1" /LENGTH=201 /DNA_ID=CAMNT_0016100153 /DNA_START=25 /DNA_END=626 /DNA_ORIENTATION=+